MKNLLKIFLFILPISIGTAQWTAELLPFNETTSNNEVLYSDSNFLVVKDEYDAARVSIDQAKTWETKGAFGAQISCAAVLNKVIYIGTKNNGIFSSSNNGKNWIRSGNYSSVDDLLLCGNILLAATNDGVKKFNVTTGMWEDQGLKGVSVDRIFYNPFEKTIYLVTFFDLYLSTDFGVTAKKIQSPGFSSISSMDFQLNQYCWASFSGIFFSNDNGATFTRLQNSPADEPSSVIFSGDYIYASFSAFQKASSEGVHRYKISTNTWESYNEGLNHTNIKLMRYNGKDRLFAIHVDNTFTPKLYSRPFQLISKTVSVPSINELKVNILNDQLILSESVDFLEIYDGNSNLISSYKIKDHQYDLTDLPSGIYYYRAILQDKVFTGRVLNIK